MLTYYINEFVVFSFLGWVYESIFCTVRKHHWQNRGFLFGPVCPIYGSCVVLGDLLFRMISRKTGVEMSATPLWEVFLAATLGSAVIEFLTSYILEKRFHATWWDYSHLPLNINGRVCLLYSLFWGILGVAWVKLMIPLFTYIFEKVNIPFAHVIICGFVAFFIFDAALSASAGIRMNQRKEGIEPRNRYEQFLDTHYDDETMHKIYANSVNADSIE